MILGRAPLQLGELLGEDLVISLRQQSETREGDDAVRKVKNNPTKSASRPAGRRRTVRLLSSISLMSDELGPLLAGALEGGAAMALRTD